MVAQVLALVPFERLTCDPPERSEGGLREDPVSGAAGARGPEEGPPSGPPPSDRHRLAARTARAPRPAPPRQGLCLCEVARGRQPRPALVARPQAPKGREIPAQGKAPTAGRDVALGAGHPTDTSPVGATGKRSLARRYKAHVPVSAVTELPPGRQAEGSLDEPRRPLKPRVKAKRSRRLAHECGCEVGDVVRVLDGDRLCAERVRGRPVELGEREHL